MSTASGTEALSPIGRPAPVVRLFGWIMLAVTGAFLINNLLIVGFGFPSLGALFGEDLRAWILALIYIVAIAAAAIFVMRTPDRALRFDADKISRFNAYIIRGCFFAVLFVGVADAIIAFIRVEGLLPVVFSEELAKDLIRAR